MEKLSAISQGPKDIERTLALKGIYLEDIIAAEEAIEAKRLEINAMEEEYQNHVSELKKKREESEKALSDGESELNQKEQELIQRKGELEEAESDYFENYDETKEKLADGISEVTKQIDNINQIEGKWLTLNRDMIESYTGYRQDAERMDAIGKVFPAIFFLVAALVSLTTMTRMVDEERTQIGTLKALGYSKRQIASKYIRYAFYATLSGSVIGFLAGSKIFPYIIITTYKLVYAALPTVVIPVHWFYSALATALAVCVTLLATLISITTSLRDTPATLMRPVAPKPGKRVLLEHIGILWNHLSFTRKASLRNMFRYKKRFFMTVIGIGGCMALLLVGFGIKDSICVMSELQYEKLCLYDLNAGIDASASREEIEEFKAKIQEEKEVTAFDFCKELSMEAQTDEGTKSLTLTVLPTEASFDSFYSFSDRVTGERYKLTENGAFITEKIARMLNVSVGDQIILKPTETRSVPVTVSGIVENYLFHYMYMTEKAYTEAFGESVAYSGCLMKLSVSGKEAEEAFAETLLTNYPLISGVTVTSSIQATIDDMLKSLNVITYVLIVCAGMLAFIVLYNLSNINMNERKRELATLKVLGFYDREVSAYIYRENILLTILGIFAGVFLGKVLHAFIMQTVEVDLVMFGRIIQPVSYIYSICLTFIFAVLIGFFMHFRLKKIDMIESLKSVE